MEPYLVPTASPDPGRVRRAPEPGRSRAPEPGRPTGGSAWLALAPFLNFCAAAPTVFITPTFIAPMLDMTPTLGPFEPKTCDETGVRRKNRTTDTDDPCITARA